MLLRFALCLLLVPACAASSARALTVYTEAAQGDLSNDGLAPTALSVEPGSNQVFGSTGRAAAIDLDYFTFTVPAGHEWRELVLLPGTAAGGSLSFVGVQAGARVTVSPNAADAAGLLGWTHYNAASIGFDLLPFMAVSSLGSAGFTPPLPAGDYAVWLQDFNVGSFAYGFDVRIAAVPEPGCATPSLATLLAGFVLGRTRARRILAR